MHSDPATNRPSRARRAAEAVFAAAVVGFLLSFPVRTVLRGRVGKTTTLEGENRTATPFPDLRSTPAKEWGRGIEAWYDDAMPGRKWLLGKARKIHVEWLRSPFGIFVPGSGKHWFDQGEQWPEMEDYLGAFQLSGQTLERWADLFMGRRTWAEAMGCTALFAVSPPKVQVASSEVPWILSRHRGTGLFGQLTRFLENAGESANVFSLRAALVSPEDGRPLFFGKGDHHPDGEGLYRMYSEVAGHIPGCGTVPWHGDSPPEEVAAGNVPGAWCEGGLLHVSVPGSATDRPDVLALAPVTRGGNKHSVSEKRDGPGSLHVVFAHSSYFGSAFAWWRNPSLPVSFPFDGSVVRTDSLLWKNLTQSDLDYIVSDSVPSAIVQEINEWQLSFSPTVFGWNEEVSRAAAFGRAEPLSGNAEPGPDDVVCVRAILADVEAGGLRSMPLSKKRPKATATLFRDGEPVASSRVNPGVRRPVFFPPLPCGGGDFRIEVSGGSARLESLDVRRAAK